MPRTPRPPARDAETSRSSSRQISSALCGRTRTGMWMSAVMMSIECYCTDKKPHFRSLTRDAPVHRHANIITGASMAPTCRSRPSEQLGCGARSETMPVAVCVAAAAKTSHAAREVTARRARSDCRQSSKMLRRAIHGLSNRPSSGFRRSSCAPWMSGAAPTVLGANRCNGRAYTPLCHRSGPFRLS